MIQNIVCGCVLVQPLLSYANFARLKVLHLEHNQINRLPGASAFQRSAIVVV
jgi:hypothetical protein